MQPQNQILRQVVDVPTCMAMTHLQQISDSIHHCQRPLENLYFCAMDTIDFIPKRNHSLSPCVRPSSNTILALLRTISPGNSESAIVGGQSKNVVCCSQFPAASRSVLRHGAQIDDTGCLEISAPQQDFSYVQKLVQQLALVLLLERTN